MRPSLTSLNPAPNNEASTTSNNWTLPPYTSVRPSRPVYDFPKKIWQNWKDNSETPNDKFAGFPHRWRSLNPTHRYERMTDHNMVAYVQDHFSSDISMLFTNVTHPTMRTDFLKYLVMLADGGIWSDIVVNPLQPTDRWIPDEYRVFANIVIGIERDRQKGRIWPDVPYSVQFAQYVMLAKPGHPAMANLVSQVADNLGMFLQSDVSRISVPSAEVRYLTGPVAFTRAFMDYISEVTGVVHTGDELSNLQEPRLIGDVLVLPQSAFGWLEHKQSLAKGDSTMLVDHQYIDSWTRWRTD